MVVPPIGLFLNLTTVPPIPASFVRQCFPTVKWVGVVNGLRDTVPTAIAIASLALKSDHPFPIAHAASRILRQKTVAPGAVLLITDQEKDFIGAGMGHIRTLFVGPFVVGELLPDIWCPTVADLAKWQAGQYLGEKRADGDGNGGTMVSGLTPANYDAQAVLWATGRYIAKDDIRAEVHLLTQRILALKKWKTGSVDPALIQITKDSIRRIEQTQGAFTLITAVPPKPHSSDRMAQLLQSALPHDTRVTPDLIRLAKPKINKQAQLARPARKDNVQGAYVISHGRVSVAGQHVLVLDDVVTTGATLAEIAKVLENQGASVSCLALAVDQKLRTSSRLQLPCTNPNCNGHMVVKMNRTSFEPFFGCTNWMPDGGCRERLTHQAGMIRYRGLQPTPAILDDWDLPF